MAGAEAPPLSTDRSSEYASKVEGVDAEQFSYLSQSPIEPANSHSRENSWATAPEKAAAPECFCADFEG